MKKLGRVIKKYVVLGLWNTAVVYAIYSIYVILWLHFDADQYLRWLAGGIPMSLGTGWLIVRANLWAAKRWFP